MFQQNKNSMSSIIGSDLELQGDINIKGDLLVYGVVNGNINCEGMVTTAKESQINGNVKTVFADISGIINGNLEAKSKVSLSSSANLKGDLLATILVIEEGASFNGLCEMNLDQVSKSNLSSNQKVTNLNEGTQK
tara:strand:+ start:163 stop:567 length:405 start_codon:yes stop_codon:yes gene_type:complete